MKATYQTLDEYLDALDTIKEKVAEQTQGMSAKQVQAYFDRFRRAIRKALCVDPANRFPSAAAFSNAIAKIKIKNDWSVTLRPDGSGEWRAPRNGRSLIVSLEKKGRLWNVSLHVESNGKARRYRSALWQSGLNKARADVYLTQLFALLE